jgi:isopentenyl diphosphate isomerase/L-lactate dehydrogenase-like FMN-dependent dehydrogenase
LNAFLKLTLKGIVTREDGGLAVEHGVDEIVLWSHAGRSDPSGRGTIKLVPEVAAGIQGRVPVLLDGGIRRGTDVFKALAVGIGRLHVWGWRRSGKKASTP